jgi:hypothetical protein
MALEQNPAYEPVAFFKLKAESIKRKAIVVPHYEG